MQSNAQEVVLNKRGLSTEAVTNALDKADKIIEKLSLMDSFAKENVTNVIANRYMELREIHIAYEKRNAGIESLELSKQKKILYWSVLIIIITTTCIGPVSDTSHGFPFI